MRGLIAAAALLVPALTSALVVPNTWDGDDRHEAVDIYNLPGHCHHRHWHHRHRHHPFKIHHPYILISSLLLFTLIMLRIHYRLGRSKRAATLAASDYVSTNKSKKRRGCLGRHGPCCSKETREYDDKDGGLPFHEPHPAYSIPSHISYEIAELRAAADIVDDIVSRSSEDGRSYARRGSASTMETLPEYKDREVDVKMGGEELPGYTDSEEQVPVVDGYTPGTTEAWRAGTDGVDVKQ